MKHILKHIKKYIPFVFLSLFFLSMQAMCNLYMPNLMSEIVNVGIQDYSAQISQAAGDSAKQILKDEQMQYIFTTGGKMLILAFLTIFVDLCVHFVNAYSGTGIAKNLRRAVFGKIESFQSQEFNEFSTSSLITRTTNDVQQIQQLFTFGLRMVFYSPIMGVGAVIMAVRKAPSMAWINLLTVVLVSALMIRIYTLLTKKFTVLQKIIDRLNLVARESISGIMVVRAFSKEKYEEEKFDNVNSEYAKTNLFVNRATAVMNPTLALIQNIIPVIIVVAGAEKIAQSSVQVGDIMAFIQYSATIMHSFMMISMLFVMLPKASVSINRISEILSKENAILEKENCLDADFEKCSISFENVSFKYPKAQGYSLENISFKAESGEVTAIIGSTGSGKTSLVSLIPRLYEVTEGSVKINGVDIREYSITKLRDKIAYVPQKSQLFSGSIETNLKVGNKNASIEDMENAAKIAQAIDFIDEKPDKFNSFISQGGLNLSGGQRQRMAIARAVIKKAPICIFDDSFSALDFKTDAALRKALKDNLRSSNIIIVAQRVSSIMDANRIIVMDEGKIMGIGTHKQLLETCQTYREIAYSQLSKEEM